MQPKPHVDTGWVAQSSQAAHSGLERIPALEEPGEAPVILNSTFSVFYHAGCCGRLRVWTWLGLVAHIFHPSTPGA